MGIIRTYTELISLDSFLERFNYLKLNGLVGDLTFGSHRYLNQRFYTSQEWKDFKRDIILRDNGCDLGFPGYDLKNGIIIHHLNPITIEDVINGSDVLLDPENVICVSDRTHRAIHYGDGSFLELDFSERTKNDTCPWRI